MKKSDITLAMLMERLAYDPETGHFRWSHSQSVHESWRGRPAGTVDDYGYIRITFERANFRAHKLAYAFVNGALTDRRMHIDHINGIRTDNRIANLRLCTPKQNCENSKMTKSNRTGFKGVSRTGNRYRAHITHNRKHIHIGCFATPEEAHAAYCAKAIQLGWEVHRTS